MAGISKLIVMISCAAALVGCSVPPPPPPPATTTQNAPSTPRVNVIWPSSSAPPPPVSTFTLVCVEPSEGVASWLKEHYPNVAAKDMTMVDVGVGLQPDSDWVVVAARLDGSVETWLTTPDGYTQWIDIGSTNEWKRHVSWTGDRATRGKQAEALAISCLGE